MNKKTFDEILFNYKQLKYAAYCYVDSIESKNRKNIYDHEPHSDEIFIDEDTGEISWKYKKNTACHCHPEYETISKKYSVEDFLKWVKDNNIQIEKYTENWDDAPQYF